MSLFPIRSLQPEDIPPLATLWLHQWTAAHAKYVPEELTLLRTAADFERRLTEFAHQAQTAGPIAAPLGFCAVKCDEIDQIYVDQKAQGSGLAQLLLADGEARIAKAGYERGKLVCIEENKRAQAFYLRQGWVCAGRVTATLDTSNGAYPLETLLFEKNLSST